MKQTTVAAKVSIRGVGLHSGSPVNLSIHPAAAAQGIVFRRVDLPQKPLIRAIWHSVTPSPLCTTIANEQGVSVATIEHLMAALTAYGIDNARVDLDAPEVPILDGSSAPFLAALIEAGKKTLSSARRVLRVVQPVTYHDPVQGKAAMLLPSSVFKITCSIDFSSKVIGKQKRSLTLSAGTFDKQISRARTFGFLADVEKMKAAGLARGGSLENAIVIDGDTVLNPEGLRFSDECVRHKVLDAVGDLALAGMPIFGHYIAEKPGHFVNYKMLETLFGNPDSYVEEVLETPRYQPASSAGVFAHASYS